MKTPESTNAVERLDCENSLDALQVWLHTQRYNFTLERIYAQDAVLEIGTGSGFFSNILAGRCLEYTGLEFDAGACETTRRQLQGRGTLVQGDAQALPFPSASFSAEVCLEVLEHLPDYRKAMREIHRCLRPEGRVIISVPYRKYGGKNPGNPFHLYEPGEAELIEAFQQLFGKVEVWYQYFEETAIMTAARIFRLRQLLGLASIYRNLSLGESSTLKKVRIGSRGDGMKITLLLVASERRPAPQKHEKDHSPELPK
jgi:ubiquinone/menaquinone biosynthesis C-methylase UbiE